MTTEIFDLIRQDKIKRYFRATAKLNQPDLVFHITQRAAGKDLLFLEDDDYLYMLGLMKDIAEKSAIEIYCFCLMPNHLHLLLSLKKKNLYDVMRNMFSQYAMRFNRKYERKGHLFGGPYRQAVCLDKGYLLTASVYIHLNPVRANLVSDPVKYRWSSCRLYCKNSRPRSFINSDFILSMVSEKEGKAYYRKLLNQGCEIEAEHILEKEDSIERFWLKLSSLFPVLFGKIGDGNWITNYFGIDLIGIDELERQTQEIKGKTRSNKPESLRAKKYLIEQLIARGFKRGEIAGRLGISRKTVYNILKSILPKYAQS